MTHSLDWEFESESFLKKDFLCNKADILHQYLLKCFSFIGKMFFSHQGFDLKLVAKETFRTHYNFLFWVSWYAVRRQDSVCLLKWFKKRLKGDMELSRKS